MIRTYDMGDFYIHVTDFQYLYNIAPWFSNADLFVASSGLLASIVIWSVVRSHRLKSHPFTKIMAVLALSLLMVGAVSYAAYQPPCRSKCTYVQAIVRPLPQSTFTINCTTGNDLTFHNKLMLPANGTLAQAQGAAEQWCSTMNSAASPSLNNFTYNLWSVVG
jgi:glucan phosphoethanolaminetransferase (alkaline phosphatase superfamily)